MENAKTVLVCMTNATEKWMRQNQIVKSKIPPKVAVFCYVYFLLARIAYLLLVFFIKIIHPRESKYDSWNRDRFS